MFENKTINPFFKQQRSHGFNSYDRNLSYQYVRSLSLNDYYSRYRLPSSGNTPIPIYDIRSVIKYNQGDIRHGGVNE